MVRCLLITGLCALGVPWVGAERSLVAPGGATAPRVVAEVPNNDSREAPPLGGVPAGRDIAPTDSPELAADAAAADRSVLSAAVALNYCRASFHRIRQTPTKAVLFEEQEKILNNLNLGAIAEPEVIQLYTAVLDEINQVGLADYERRLTQDHHRSSLQRKLTWDALAFGTDLATAQFGSAVKTGANSWWDYRAMSFQRDADLLKIDKQRMSTVMSKSSQFLDTFWRIAQKRQIPDRWLIRGDDLDALNRAVQEPDPRVRLRVMRRMAGFMEAYPPYWYYLARTQQELGELTDAVDTYVRLTSLGDGHFRRDDMLATGLANQAAIEEFLDRPEAVATTRRALEYSTDVWEANLVCARVLQRRRLFAEAEDAVLRNLDADLETDRSRTFLVAVYYYAEDRDKLARTLADPEFAGLPAPVLARCAALLGPDETPPGVRRMLASSLSAEPRIQFGPDEVMLYASPAWRLHLAKIQAEVDGQTATPIHVATNAGPHGGDGTQEVRLTLDRDLANPFQAASTPWKVTVTLTYPDSSKVTLSLREDPNRTNPATLRATNFRGPIAPSLTVAAMHAGERQVPLERRAEAPGERPAAALDGAAQATTGLLPEAPFPRLLPIEFEPGQ